MAMYYDGIIFIVLTLIEDVAPPVLIFNSTPELKNKIKAHILIHNITFLIRLDYWYN
jgi:hypothetical protein